MKGDLCVYAPQTMQVAVSVSSNGFVAIGQHENSLWLFACLQLFALAALVSRTIHLMKCSSSIG